MYLCTRANCMALWIGSEMYFIKWVSRWLILWKEFGQWGRLEGRRRLGWGGTDKQAVRERERERGRADGHMMN